MRFLRSSLFFNFFFLGLVRFVFFFCLAVLGCAVFYAHLISLRVFNTFKEFLVLWRGGGGLGKVPGSRHHIIDYVGLFSKRFISLSISDSLTLPRFALSTDFFFNCALFVDPWRVWGGETRGLGDWQWPRRAVTRLATCLTQNKRTSSLTIPLFTTRREIMPKCVFNYIYLYLCLFIYLFLFLFISNKPCLQSKNVWFFMSPINILVEM